MPTISRLLAVSLLASAAVLALPCSPAWACSCAEQTDQERFAGSTHVFVGAPVASQKDGGYVWTFEVESVQKGDVASFQAVKVSTTNVESCGFAFEDGTRYQVFAYDDGTGLRTGLCAGNRELSQVDPLEPKGSRTPTPVPEPALTSSPAPSEGASPAPEESPGGVAAQPAGGKSEGGGIPPWAWGLGAAGIAGILLVAVRRRPS